MNLVGTIAVGTAGNVTTELIKGNINSPEDVAVSAVKGGIINGFGYGIAKGIATLRIKQIGNIEYSARDCAARPLKLSIHSGGIEHACRRR